MRTRAGWLLVLAAFACDSGSEPPAEEPAPRPADSEGPRSDDASFCLRLVDVEPVEGRSILLQPPSAPSPDAPILADALDESAAWVGLDGAPALPADRVLPVGEARWLRILDCGAARDLRVQIRWSGPDAIPLGLVELETPPGQMPEPEALRGAVRPREPREAEDGVFARERRLRLAPRTTALALLLSNRGDAPLRLQGISVFALTGADRVALTRAESDESFPSPVAGRYGVGHYSLEALLAPTPSRLVYDLDEAPDQPLWLHTSFGVLRDELDQGRRRVDFRVSVQDGDEVREVATQSIELGPDDAAARGPFFRRIELGRVPRGARLVLETHSQGEGDGIVQAAFGHPVLRSGPPAHARGLVLVSLDTVRADRLGCYGNEQELTPVVDALAAESTRFARATAHASFTLPSHAAAFSGQYPSLHGMQKPGQRRDPAVTRFLAEYARDAGYRTIALTGGGQLAPAFGMAAGYEIYGWRDSLLTGDLADLDLLLEQLGDEPLMLFLHTYAAHHYEPPRDILDRVHPPCGSPLHERDSLRDYMLLVRQREFDDVDKAHLAGVYDACVAFADRQFGLALDVLRAHGVPDRDPLVLFSDHGEELFDHGQVGHGFRAPFQEQVHVPLMVRPPGGGEARVFEGVVELVDLMPTAMDLLDLRSPRMIQGKSLVEALEGGRELGGLAWSETPSGRYRSLQSARWKAIQHRPPGESGEGQLRVFDLVKDPAETAVLPVDDPLHEQAVQEYRAAADTLERLVRRLDAQVRQSDLSPEEVRALIEMGYIEFDFRVAEDEEEDGEGAGQPDQDGSPAPEEGS